MKVKRGAKPYTCTCTSKPKWVIEIEEGFTEEAVMLKRGD